MDMLLYCFLFAIGLALVVKGGDFFVDAASWIAKAMHIPPFIVGATIVSLATTMPEMIVSVMASISGQNDMALGNAVGSVTANTSLIMAITMLTMSVSFPRKQYIKQSLVLIFSVALLLLSCLGGSLHFVGGILLALLFCYSMFENVRSARKNPEFAEEKQPIDKKKFALNTLFFILGAAGIVGGSRLMVDYGQKIAEFLGVPERVIAVTLVAVGTSLPELVTTVTAIIKKESSLSVGNIIGANVIDICLILPVCSLVSGKQLPVSKASLILDFPVCLAVCLIAILPSLIRQKSSKIQGGLLMAAYAAYIAVTVFVLQ